MRHALLLGTETPRDEAILLVKRDELDRLLAAVEQARPRDRLHTTLGRELRAVIDHLAGVSG